MGTITIHPSTTHNPISLCGEFAGICWGADTTDKDKNYKRGLSCLHSGHGKTLEFAQVYLIIDGYSARVIRELYTHQSGLPTKLQASTRYINYDDFKYVTPPLGKDSEAQKLYSNTMDSIDAAARVMENELGIKREDAAMLFPLGMETKIVYRTNLRALIDMAKTRLCNRAYWEYRKLMQDIKKALMEYSEEWKYLIHDENILKPKCAHCGFCDEEKSCGFYPKKKDIEYMQNLILNFHRNGIMPKNDEELIQALYETGGEI